MPDFSALQTGGGAGGQLHRKAVQSGFAEYGRTIAQVGGEFCSRQVRGQKRTGQRCVQGEVRPAARFP